MPEKYPPGTVVEGVVGNLKDYGAFVEIEEGIDGLLHVNEMSWVREGGPPQRGRQQRRPRPLRCPRHRPGAQAHCLEPQADDQRPVGGGHPVALQAWPGQAREGVELDDFGAFVELEPGLEGLLHGSELADHEGKRPGEVIQVGQMLTVRILSVDPVKRQLRLSLPLEADGLAQLAPELPSGPWSRDDAEESLAQARPAEQPAGPAAVVVPALRAPTPEAVLPASALACGREAEPGELAPDSSEVARPPTPPPAEARPPTRPASSPTPKAEAAPPGPPPEPASSTAARGFDPSRLLRRLPHEQHADLDDEEHDGLAEAGVLASGPAGDGREPDGDLDAWLRQVSADTDLAFALDQCGLHAAASLVRTTEGLDDPGPFWEPLPAWATLSALLSAQPEAADRPKAQCRPAGGVAPRPGRQPC